MMLCARCLESILIDLELVSRVLAKNWQVNRCIVGRCIGYGMLQLDAGYLDPNAAHLVVSGCWKVP